MGSEHQRHLASEALLRSARLEAQVKPEWDGDAAKLDQNFPALGSGPAAVPKGAWGLGDAAARLQKLSEQGQC